MGIRMTDAGKEMGKDHLHSAVDGPAFGFRFDPLFYEYSLVGTGVDLIGLIRTSIGVLIRSGYLPSPQHCRRSTKEFFSDESHQGEAGF